MIDFQFYPTPKKLAVKAWSKFQNRNFQRVLDPSAGNGDLLLAEPRLFDQWRGSRCGLRSDVTVDVVEIDIARHAALREKGFTVVGLDFLQHQATANYSHVILNPPFARGADHALKAWDLLWDGEMVAILNAETLRNPSDKTRTALLKLVEAHGSVEYLQDEFLTEETQRHTPVEIALIHLVKRCDPAELSLKFIDDLQSDDAPGHLADGHEEYSRALALPEGFVERQVRAFRSAVQATRTAALEAARAEKFANALGQPLAKHGQEAASEDGQISVGAIRKDLNKRYDELKDRAWTSILRSMDVTSALTAKAQKTVESQFAEIKTLEFSCTNAYAFLAGLCEGRGEMTMECLCDVFDWITRFHSDNTVYFKGWKSNDKHHGLGRRIRMSRIVLPYIKASYSGNDFDWDTTRQLGDLDKAMAMLDGKTVNSEGFRGIVAAAKSVQGRLQDAGRIGSDYFDFRYYRGTQTLHLYPKSKALIDRLNRLVGAHRGWLPPPGKPVSKDFWLQYEQAERFDAEFRQGAQGASTDRWRTDAVLRALNCAFDPEYRGGINDIQADVHKARGVMLGVLEKNGINPEFALGHEQQDEPLMLVA